MMERNLKLQVVFTSIFCLVFLLNGLIITVYNIDKSISAGEMGMKTRAIAESINLLTEKISGSDSLINFSDKATSMGYKSEGVFMYLEREQSIAQAK